MPPGWEDYLAAIDDPPAAAEDREAAQWFMEKNRVGEPRKAVGLTVKDLSLIHI